MGRRVWVHRFRREGRGRVRREHERRASLSNFMKRSIRCVFPWPSRRTGDGGLRRAVREYAFFPRGFTGGSVTRAHINDRKRERMPVERDQMQRK
jgi:hypothetical protein